MFGFLSSTGRQFQSIGAAAAKVLYTLTCLIPNEQRWCGDMRTRRLQPLLV